MTREEAEAYQQDAELAGKFLIGVYHHDSEGFVAKIEFLSKGAKPTEKEGRAALARILRGKATMSDGIRGTLADMFDPGLDIPRKLVFETVNHQHATSVRNAQIASWIYGLRHKWPDEHGPEWDDVNQKWKWTRNKTYEEAVRAAADKFGISERHAKRIYAETFLKGHRSGRRLKRRTKGKPKLRLVR